MKKFLPRCLHDDKVKLHGVDGVLHTPGVVLQRTRQERLPHKKTIWEREPPKTIKYSIRSEQDASTTRVEM